MPIDERRIPRNVILPIALKYRRLIPADPDKWTDYEVGQVRSECGAEWASCPTENVRCQIVNLRKAGDLGTIGKTKNHGASKIEKEPDGYAEYLKSPHWLVFRATILEFWGYRCAHCYREVPLEVHHRTYIRLGREEITDCVPLCRPHHQAAHRADQRMIKNDEANHPLFS